jgi:hypothetical protein
VTKEDLGVLGFILALAVAAWNMFKFWQEGARIRVTMKPGTLGGSALTTMTTLRPDRHPGSTGRNGSRFNVEVALVQVENFGRTAVTIRDTGLDFGRTSPWKVWKRGRHTISLKFLKFEGCETDPKIRLQPYDSVQFLINMNHALYVAQTMGPKTFNVRVSLQVAGKGIVRSPWRDRWHFAKGHPPRLWLDEPFDLAREIYRFLSRTLTPEKSSAAIFLGEISMRLAEHVEHGGETTEEAFESIIESWLESLSLDEKMMTALWARDLVSTLRSPEGGPFDSAAFRDRRTARYGRLI